MKINYFFLILVSVLYICDAKSKSEKSAISELFKNIPINTKFISSNNLTLEHKDGKWKYIFYFDPVDKNKYISFDLTELKREGDFEVSQYKQLKMDLKDHKEVFNPYVRIMIPTTDLAYSHCLFLEMKMEMCDTEGKNCKEFKGHEPFFVGQADKIIVTSPEKYSKFYGSTYAFLSRKSGQSVKSDNLYGTAKMLVVLDRTKADFIFKYDNEFIKTITAEDVDLNYPFAKFKVNNTEVSFDILRIKSFGKDENIEEIMGVYKIDTAGIDGCFNMKAQ